MIRSDKTTFISSVVKQVLSYVPKRTTERIVLVMSLSAAVLAWYLTNTNFESRNQGRFLAEAEQVRGRIEKRMAEYEQVLRGGVGLYNSSNEVSRQEWHDYVRTCEVQQHFPGIQAMAVAVIVPEDERQSFIEKVRSEGFDDYRIHPAGKRDTYTAIVFIEPFDWRNQRAFGYDMYSEPVRRTAMDRSIDTGLPSISGKITLLQETNKNVQPGVLCYLPYYAGHETPQSVEERRKSIRGWVYAAFRMNDLMDGIVGSDNSDVAFRIFDSKSKDFESLLFDSDEEVDYVSNNRFVSVTQADVSGREWTIEFAAKPQFFGATQTVISWLVALGGILFNGFLFVVMHSLRLQRESAIRLANKMTAGFETSESRNQLVLENASEAILSVSDKGEIVAANRAAHRVFNANETLVGTDFAQLVPDLDLSEVAQHSNPSSNDEETGIAISCRQLDGHEFPGRLSVGYLNAAGSESYIVIVRDETARVEAEKKQEQMTKELVVASHKAGKAEVATGVLHNVGNVVNSISVAAALLREEVNATPIGTLSKAAAIITENEKDLGDFFKNDKRAVHFPELLRRLVGSFEEAKQRQVVELETLSNNVQHIKEVITMQQASAKKTSSVETIEPHRLFEDAIKMNEDHLRRDDVMIVRKFEEIPATELRKHDVLQILVNLLKNAKQATDMSSKNEKLIELLLSKDSQSLVFSVRDNGVGIPQENIEKIFKHGFTTKETGHGFGLHSCFNAARDMGGSLTVDSKGNDQGATFSLRLPVQSPNANASGNEDSQKQSSGFPSIDTPDTNNNLGILQ